MSTGPLSCRRSSRCSLPRSRCRIAPPPARAALAPDTFNAERAFGADESGAAVADGAGQGLPGSHARLGRRPRDGGLHRPRPGRARRAGRAAGVQRAPDHERRRAGDRRGHAARVRRRAGSSCSPTATPAASPSSPAPRRCSSWRASTRPATCARRSCSSPPPARRTASPAPASGRSRSRGRSTRVLVLGDLAGAKIKKPWVVSLAARRPARRRSASSGPSRPRSGARSAATPAARAPLGQWMRRALPVTVSEQGPIGAEGLPAVLLSESGELGPSPASPCWRSASTRSGARRCAPSAGWTPPAAATSPPSRPPRTGS